MTLTIRGDYITYLRETPWDKRNFGVNTYEVTDIGKEALEETDAYEGHFTIKVDPLENPEPLLRHGFYYVDTLIEPVCQRDNLQVFEDNHVRITKDYNPSAILAIAEEAFTLGRFHRDFHIPDALADKRYKNWVDDLQQSGKLFALTYDSDTVGFYGFSDNKVLLLGVRKDYRGQGFAKRFTSLSCREHFKAGYEELQTSVSAVNAPSLNLFYTLGFRLRGAVDVYHKLNGAFA
ncbi:hypothetical protein GCM10028778_06640 [Barrientosiimonas marina]|uniref:GNAT family N-acetyltransferase n=1 Tax=Lentibacillus kimchii TaxID=1542911 RepID=A0ABW2V0A4_9BACI